MRIRTIKPEFFEDEALAALPPHARLLFIGLWGLADKNGVLEDRPAWIKAKIFPYENGDTVDVSQLLPHLVTGRHLIRYVANGRQLLMVRNFAKHQRITGKEGEGEGRFPLPPMDLCNGDTMGTQWGHNGDHLGAQEREREREQGKVCEDFPADAARTDLPNLPRSKDEWRYVQSEPWMRALKAAGCLALRKDWEAWKGLTERTDGGVEAVVDACSLVEAKRRFHDTVEAAVNESPPERRYSPELEAELNRMYGIDPGKATV